MRITIIGHKRSGKTTLIINKIIPTLNNYLVLDFNNEYYTCGIPKKKIKVFKYNPLHTRFSVIKSIRNTKKSKILIFEGIEVFGNNINWLISELKDRHFIFVFHSFKNTNLINIADEIYISKKCCDCQDCGDISTFKNKSNLTIF